MIFVSCEMTNLEGEHAHYRRLLDEGARIVFVNGTLSGFDVPSVGVDERAAGELATRHLIDLGHKRIGFVAGPEHYLPTQRRGRQGASPRCAPPGSSRTASSPTRTSAWPAGARRIAKLLDRDDAPTAVICSSDVMAIGVLQEAGERGLRVPRDLSVVGFDGIAAEWTQPRLTTIEQPIAEIAETAVQALRRLIDEPGRPLPQLRVPPAAQRRRLDRLAERQGSHDVRERLERLERLAPLLEVAREPVPGEHPLGGERGAAVGVADRPT